MTQVSQGTTIETAMAQIDTEYGRTNYISSYCRTHNSAPSDMRRALRELKIALDMAGGMATVIGMDANAKSSLWFSDHTDKKGEKLEQFVALHNLRICNKEQDKRIFEGPRGGSDIDVTLLKGTGNTRLEAWRVIDGVTISDHNLITFVVRNPGRVPSNPRQQTALLPRRFRMTKDKFSTLKLRIAEGLERSVCRLDTREDIDTAVATLTSIVTEACENTLGVIKPQRKVARWWTKELDKLRWECFDARRKMQETTDPGKRGRKAEAYSQTIIHKRSPQGQNRVLEKIHRDEGRKGLVEDCRKTKENRTNRWRGGSDIGEMENDYLDGGR